MPRNSSGSYSLPAGNPVVTHTTITSTWANSTLSDVGSEISSSLDRSGRGAMLAPLPLANGSSALPALTFSAETSSGLFRNASQDIEMSVNGTVVQKWLPTGIAATLGAVLTQSQTNTVALTATGNGTAAGATLTGGSSNGSGVTGIGGGTSGAGVTATGASSTGNGIVATGGGTGAGVVATGGDSNGNGITSTGDGTGAGVTATGGDTSGAGVIATGGDSSGVGVIATGTGGGYGVLAVGGSAASGIKATAGHASSYGVEAFGISGGPGIVAASSATDVVVAKADGYIDLAGGARPTSTTGFLDTLTRSNIIKAWGNVRSNGAGAVTVTDAFNITSCAVGSPTTKVTCTFATDMANTNYAVVVNFNGATFFAGITAGSFNRAVGSFDVGAVASGVAVDWSGVTTEAGFSFLVLGAQ